MTDPDAAPQEPTFADRLAKQGELAFQAQMAERTSTPSPTQCGRCHQRFESAGPAFDGRARYGDTPYCRRCIDRCHESTDSAHTCVICGGEG